jgi:hypothetical protein
MVVDLVSETVTILRYELGVGEENHTFDMKLRVDGKSALTMFGIMSCKLVGKGC